MSVTKNEYEDLQFWFYGLLASKSCTGTSNCHVNSGPCYMNPGMPVVLPGALWGEEVISI